MTTPSIDLKFRRFSKKVYGYKDITKYFRTCLSTKDIIELWLKKSLSVQIRQMRPDGQVVKLSIATD